MTLLALLAAWEVLWWARRRRARERAYAEALAEARRLGRPLVVVGAPDRGLTGGYGCGDATVDLGPTRCPRWLRADVCGRLPLADDSCVVLCSCVLEYVDDPAAALREMGRVSGGRVWVVGVEPWTMAGWLYPGTRHPGVGTAASRQLAPATALGYR